jgi:hypothetical protein
MPGAPRARLPGYGLAGLGVMIASEAGMLLRTEPFWSWHTPIVWTGYILFADGLVRSRRGSSWLTTAPGEFAFLAAASVPLWLVFEGYNQFIQNWHYINLPPNAALRLLGYGWSFATIWPAIFETAELVASVRGEPEARTPAPAAGGPPRSAWPAVSIVAGTAMLVWPLVWPSRYLAAPVWLGFIFLLDPLNERAGRESLMGDFRRGWRDRAVNLILAGLACGVLWEFWNFWARTKWIYTVPILPDVRLFEMPLPGYLGFPAFALECFALYVCARGWLWRGRVRPVGL